MFILFFLVRTRVTYTVLLHQNRTDPIPVYDDTKTILIIIILIRRIIIYKVHIVSMHNVDEVSPHCCG